MPYHLADGFRVVIYTDDHERSEQEMDAMLEQAEVNARIADLTEPRAISAHYDRDTNKIVIHLRDGSTFMFPSHLGQGLTDASAEDLAAIEITPSGYGLHWENLDVDLSVPSLLKGIYGTCAWMEQLQAIV